MPSNSGFIRIYTTLLFILSSMIATVFTPVLSVSSDRRESVTYHNLRSDEQLQVCYKYITAFGIAYRCEFNLIILNTC